MSQVIAVWSKLGITSVTNALTIVNYMVTKHNNSLHHLAFELVNSKTWDNSSISSHIAKQRNNGHTFFSYIYCCLVNNYDDDMAKIDLSYDNTIRFIRNLNDTSVVFSDLEMRKFIYQLLFIVGGREMVYRLLFNKCICFIDDLKHLQQLFTNVFTFNNNVRLHRIWNNDIIFLIGQYINDFKSFVIFSCLQRNFYQCLWNTKLIAKHKLFKYEYINDFKMLQYNDLISDDWIWRGSLYYISETSFRTSILCQDKYAVERPCLTHYAGSLWDLKTIPKNLCKIRYLADADQKNRELIYHYYKWTKVFMAGVQNPFIFSSVENDKFHSFNFPIPAQMVLLLNSQITLTSLMSVMTIKDSRWWIFRDSLIDLNVNERSFNIQEQRISILDKHANKELFVFSQKLLDEQQWIGWRRLLRFGNLFNYVTKLIMLIPLTSTFGVAFYQFLEYLAVKTGAPCEITMLFECVNHDGKQCNHSKIVHTLKSWFDHELHAVIDNDIILVFQIGFIVSKSTLQQGDLIDFKKMDSLTDIITAYNKLFAYLENDQTEVSSASVTKIVKFWQFTVDYLYNNS